MAKAPQTCANHARYVPMYHGPALWILAINFFWSLYRAYRTTSADTVFGIFLAFALLLLFFYARGFALTAQDRIIRLEERLRMQKLLPVDLQPRINDFTPGQLIGLRFASDEELPELARTVLRDNIAHRSAIKKMVKNWRADYLRV